MVKSVSVAAVVVLLAGGIAVSAAAAPETGMPPFPASADEGSAMLWLKDNTSLGVGRFVSFSPDNVLVVLTDEVGARSPAVHRVSFRQEAIKLDFVSRTGGRSLRGSGEIDCATGSFRAEKVELFSGSDLRGDRIASEGPDAAGRVPRAGTAPALALTQVCNGSSAVLAPLATATARRTAKIETVRPDAPPVAVEEPTPLPPPPPRRETAPAQPPPPEPDKPQILAQIGAFGARDAAEHAWSRLADSFPELMSGKTMQVDPVTVNGMPMFRSSIGGFTSQAEAQALCNRLMASSETCFVRKTEAPFKGY